MDQQPDPRESGNDLPQQLQSLPRELGGEIREPGDVAAGSCETRHEAGGDGIARRRQDDWNPLCRLLGGLARGGEFRDEDADREPNEFLGEEVGAIDASLCRPEFDRDVPSVDVPVIAKA